MTSTDLLPEFKNILKTTYTAEFSIYGASSGITYVHIVDQASIKYIIQTDEPSVSVMPIVKIGVLLSSDNQILIQEHRHDAIINLKLVKSEKQWDENTNNYEEISKSVVYDLDFQEVITDPENVTLKMEDKLTTDIDEDGNVSTSDLKTVTNYKTIEFIVSCIKHRNEMKKVVNFNVCEDNNTSTVLKALILGLSKIVKDNNSVILQPPDNTTNYNQIIVPPNNLKDFCKHLQLAYGMYNSGLIVYRDLQFLYVIPKYTYDYVVSEMEYNKVSIYLYDKDIAAHGESAIGYYKDDANRQYVLVQAGKYSFYNSSEYFKETIGNKYKIMDHNSMVDSVKYNKDKIAYTSPMIEYTADIKGSNTLSNDRTRYFFNELNNSNINTEFVIDTNTNIIQCNFSFIGVDINLFTFNKRYIFIFNEDVTLNYKYGGDYRLVNVTKAIYQQSSNENLVLTATCVFAKMIN